MALMRATSRALVEPRILQRRAIRIPRAVPPFAAVFPKIEFILARISFKMAVFTVARTVDPCERRRYHDLLQEPRTLGTQCQSRWSLPPKAQVPGTTPAQPPASAKKVFPGVLVRYFLMLAASLLLTLAGYSRLSAQAPAPPHVRTNSAPPATSTPIFKVDVDLVLV